MALTKKDVPRVSKMYLHNTRRQLTEILGVSRPALDSFMTRYKIRKDGTYKIKQVTPNPRPKKETKDKKKELKTQSKHSKLRTGERICPVCGKIFYCSEPSIWAYKVGTRGQDKPACSWGCVMKYERKKKW